MNIPQTSLPRIVVIGAGFAGLNFCKKINKNKYQVVLIDKNNFHTFQPLLYQVATAGLEPDSIASAIRVLFKNHKNFYFRNANIFNINTEEKKIIGDIGDLAYDHLIIATGSKTNFFGNEQIENHSMPMKSVVEALDLRSLILQNFEEALLTSDLEERERLMNFVVVGGGPTGVELAGALSELKNFVLPDDYPSLDIRRMNIHLIQSSSRLLKNMSEKASKKALEYLEDSGVNVWLNTRVLNYDGKFVDTNNKDMFANTLIWAAGVKGSTIDGIDVTFLNKSRYLVNKFNEIEGLPDVFAIGDIAEMQSEEYPRGHPMVAQSAIQQGINLANNFNKKAENKELKSFNYKDKGSMATIGRNRAVADIGKYYFAGFWAWLLWMFVHLMSIVSFRNRMVALTNWIIQYFSYHHSVRLIIRPFIPYKRNQKKKISA